MRIFAWRKSRTTPSQSTSDSIASSLARVKGFQPPAKFFFEQTGNTLMFTRMDTYNWFRNEKPFLLSSFSPFHLAPSCESNSGLFFCPRSVGAEASLLIIFEHHGSRSVHEERRFRLETLRRLVETRDFRLFRGDCPRHLEGLSIASTPIDRRYTARSMIFPG